MSQLIGNALPQIIHRQKDDRIQPSFWSQEFEVDFVSQREAWFPDDFRSPWWPRGAGFIGDQGLDVGMLESVWFNRPELVAGTNSRFGVVGITRDRYGSALGGVVVKLFRTADDLLVDSKISDVNTGAYLVSTPYYPDAHYIVTYKAGTPDVFGSSLNTLVAT